MADIKKLYSRASQLYKKGRLQEAKKALQKVLKQAPQAVDALNMYGITLARLGDLPAAAEQFSKIINIEPERADAYENQARICNQMKQYLQAQIVYEQGLKYSKGSYDLHFGLAAALMSQHNYKLALDSFNKAKMIDASSPSLFINMGTSFSQLGKSDDAINAFQQALLLDPNSAEAYLRLGQLYILNNNSIQAEEVLFKASQLRADDFNIHLSLADACQQNSKNELAIKHYVIADKLQPKSQNVYTKLDKLVLYSGGKEAESILNNLAEEYVYTDWEEAVNDALRLAQLLEYPDDNSLKVLQQFLNNYNPGTLHSREWWQQQLKLFGDVKYGHDKVLRGIHSAVFSWSLPDSQTLKSIADFVEGTQLYSYGAGSALWERLLSEHFNIDVRATDFKPRHSYLPITAENYSESTIPEGDTIFLAWIVRGDTGILNILKQFKPGQKLVLIGEPPDKFGIPRICATPEMFALLKNEFTLSHAIPLVTYSMLNDTVGLYVKN